MISLSSLHPATVPGISVYVDERRNRYRVQCYRDGKRRSLTLKTTNARAAQKEFDQLAADWDRLGWALFDRKEERCLTVREAKEAFIDDNKARRLAAKTITTRESILDLLVDSVARQKALHDLTAGELRAVYRAPSLKSPASQASYFTVLRTFLRWCVKEGLLKKSPLEGVKKPGVPKKVPDYFTPEQFQALLQHIDADLEQNKHKYTGRASLVLELPDLVRFAVLTGLRRTEQLSIRWMDVDLQHGLVHVRSYVDKGRRVTFNVKDGDGRIVPLAPEAREILERRREGRTNGDDTEPVFCGLKGGRRDGAPLTDLQELRAGCKGRPGSPLLARAAPHLRLLARLRRHACRHRERLAGPRRHLAHDELLRRAHAIGTPVDGLYIPRTSSRNVLRGRRDGGK